MLTRLKNFVRQGWVGSRRKVYYNAAERDFLERLQALAPSSDADIALQAVLEQDPLFLNLYDGDWNSAVHLAVKANHLPFLRFLLARPEVKPLLNAQNWAQQTPLGIAAKHGFEEAAGLLTDAGAGLGVKSEGGFPLHHGIAGGHSKLVSLLLQKGSAINEKLKREEEPFSKERALWINGTNGEGKTALQLAATQGDQYIIEYLLVMGADPNAFSPGYPYTAFTCAQRAGQDKLNTFQTAVTKIQPNVEALNITTFRQAGAFAFEVWEDTSQLQNTRTYQFLTILFYLIWPALTVTFLLGPIAGLIAGVVAFLKYGSPEMLLWGGDVFSRKAQGFLNRVAPVWIAKTFSWVAFSMSWMVWGIFKLVWLWDIIFNPIKRFVGFCLSVVFQKLAKRFTYSEELQAASYFFGREMGFRLLDTTNKFSNQEAAQAQLERVQEHSIQIWKALGWEQSIQSYFAWRSTLEKTMGKMGETLGLTKALEYHHAFKEWVEKQTPDKVKDLQSWMQETEQTLVEGVEAGALAFLPEQDLYRKAREDAFAERKRLLDFAQQTQQADLKRTKEQLDTALEQHNKTLENELQTANRVFLGSDQNILLKEQALEAAKLKLETVMSTMPIFQHTRHPIDGSIVHAAHYYVVEYGDAYNAVQQANLDLSEAHAAKGLAGQNIQNFSQKIMQKPDQQRQAEAVSPFLQAWQLSQRQSDIGAQAYQQQQQFMIEAHFPGTLTGGVVSALSARSGPTKNGLPADKTTASSKIVSTTVSASSLPLNEGLDARIPVAPAIDIPTSPASARGLPLVPKVSHTRSSSIPVGDKRSRSVPVGDKQLQSGNLQAPALLFSKNNTATQVKVPSPIQNVPVENVHGTVDVSPDQLNGFLKGLQEGQYQNLKVIQVRDATKEQIARLSEILFTEQRVKPGEVSVQFLGDTEYCPEKLDIEKHYAQIVRFDDNNKETFDGLLSSIGEGAYRDGKILALRVTTDMQLKQLLVQIELSKQQQNVHTPLRLQFTEDSLENDVRNRLETENPVSLKSDHKPIHARRPSMHT